MIFALDAMGGDFAPHAAVQGTLDALEKTSKSLNIILLGDETAIRTELGDRDSDAIQILHTDEVVTMEDKGSKVLKSKPNSSLVRGIQLVKEGKADGFISAGHTGAIMSATLLTLGRIPGVRRPALAAYFPTEGRGKVLCDVGANPDAKPEHLAQFAIMASHYYDHVEGFADPKIGLINIGSEPGKGSNLYVETYKLLAEIPNFVGNIESRHLLTSEADVLICDGFVGNTLLKFAESWISFFTDEIKGKIDEKLSYKIGAGLLKPIFEDLKNRFDYEEHGGTPLLGVNGISIVCHGSSGPRSIMNSIFLAQKCINNNLIEDTKKSLAIHFGK
ncbi:MAG: phosphate acyltransferase PlsX [Candidatus Marinimicrobia bacterium]|jgi:glycerol-3-phosphate acyltransferase PlsX|nr:phosphate acyltransferase PlsX [Candidatus Neomarinimicrobiota bacterium]MBT3500843.1 phosphate acyltransferase PlsX [Candidatus Neomarinimicrobiota bacterium]MBT3838877.1 phosphate acyltransferase PlsX [Candidatus Neomarinimicrobiota bacterium]MBT3998854.1 phosphate acyltransferase PlsX [Candidatus Neomarinimicrobiota bacterium]MBT4282827.1 phosphate acyltransferase PlsX [Candidatus Neomarinimicrobiota bacterium]